MELKNIFKNVRKALFIASLSVVSVFGANAEEPTEGAVAEASTGDTEAGKVIFEANCTSCHQLGSSASYPELVGITKNRDNAWLTQWIKNPTKFAESNSDAADLIAEWKDKSGVMSSFDYFSDEELTNLISYLAVAKPETAKAEVQVSPEGGTTTVSSDNSQTTMILALVLVALALIVVVLLLMYSAIMKNLKDQDAAGNLTDENSEYVNQTHSIFKILKHPAFIGSVTIIVILLGAWWGLHNVIFKIGVDTGYHPTQPIPFSHKLHAGDMEIDCNYCHTGVRKAKHANVPSGSICMNCHIKIKTDSDILKGTLYKAMDFDPETGKFGPNQSPIEWVRVHNLPDHVYFNHSQHVQVAGLECEECHGPVKEMGTVYQYSTLTMGWCVDCHRNKVINSKGNEYYDNLVELHNESGEGDFTVEKNGGLECARCHY